MRRRTFLRGLAGGTAGVIAPLGIPTPLYALMAPPKRGLLIAVAQDAPPALTEAAQSIATVQDHALINVLCDGGTAKVVDSRRLLSGGAYDLAYNHLIIIGDMEDPLIEAAWQREARAARGGFYIFGMGYLKGDIGYIESDRNPFLHGQTIPVAPYEAQVIAITGTSPAGVQLAVRAFLRRSLVNGVVAAKGWIRPATSLLDHDPLDPDFAVPALAPDQIADTSRIAWTQANEDEYRGVLADTGIAPRVIWRAKYFKKGLWDGVGAVSSFDNYAAGLHRRAYGNTLWLAQFYDPGQAAAAAPKIAGAAHLRQNGKEWRGDQTAYGWPDAKYSDGTSSPGTLVLRQSEEWLTMTAMQKRIVYTCVDH